MKQLTDFTMLIELLQKTTTWSDILLKGSGQFQHHGCSNSVVNDVGTPPPVLVPAPFYWCSSCCILVSSQSATVFADRPETALRGS